ncbi:hypothetical protein [Niallia sp. Krafla_26]|uniref:hypothetical protein n=1 Tax=Niallia sp. Krafla_26 TaxID=3064703 RepID=UPI003D1779FE
MADWNQQAAPNNNLTSGTIETSNLVINRKREHPFTEELSDGGERNQIIKKQVQSKK